MQRPGAACLMAMVVLGLAFNSQARLLVVQQASFSGGTGSLYTVEEMGTSDADASQALASTSSGLILGPIFSSPFVWFQQQLMMMEALQQAAMQGLQPVMSGSDSRDVFVDGGDGLADVGQSQEELLRHVGCARMRAALLDQQARQQRMWQVADESASITASAVTRKPTTVIADGEYTEYYEDYKPSITGRVTRTAQLLRGGSADGIFPIKDDFSSEAMREAAADQIAQEAADRIVRMLDDVMFGVTVSDTYEDADEDAESYEARKALWRYRKEQRLADVAEAAFTDDMPRVTSSHADEAEAEEEYEKAIQEYEKGYEYDDEEYENEDDGDKVLFLADTMLSRLDSLLDNDPSPVSSGPRARSSGAADDWDEEWADYLEQAYEYYSVYTDDMDDTQSYYESYMDPYDDTPDALDMLASIAELVALSSSSSGMVLHLLPVSISISSAIGGGSPFSRLDALLQQQELRGLQLQALQERSDAYEQVQVQQGGPTHMQLVFAGEPFDGERDVFSFGSTSASNDDLILKGQYPGYYPDVVVDNFYLHWSNPDGSLNWGLVTLCILSAGTACMLVGFVASWLSLRRTLGTAVVHNGRRACRTSKGSEVDCELDNPLLLLPEDCYGAEPLKVEHASSYVPPVLSNDSVAKALAK